MKSLKCDVCSKAKAVNGCYCEVCVDAVDISMWIEWNFFRLDADTQKKLREIHNSRKEDMA